MKRALILLLMIAWPALGKDWRPNEAEISYHRKEVYAAAFDYIVRTFNLEVQDASQFNPVRFDSRGVWGNFEARLKELGDDRFEVQGWVTANGHDKPRLRWSVHIRYPLLDPERWRYMRVDADLTVKPEFLGWKFGDYWSIGYKAEYDEKYLAAAYQQHR